MIQQQPLHPQQAQQTTPSSSSSPPPPPQSQRSIEESRFPDMHPPRQLLLELERRREKRGECIGCGQKLFKASLLSIRSGGGKRLPLTNAHVLSGRCLTCHPLDAIEHAAAAVLAIQQHPSNNPNPRSNLNLQQPQPHTHIHTGTPLSLKKSPTAPSLSAVVSPLHPNPQYPPIAATTTKTKAPVPGAAPTLPPFRKRDPSEATAEDLEVYGYGAQVPRSVEWRRRERKHTQNHSNKSNSCNHSNTNTNNNNNENNANQNGNHDNADVDDDTMTLVSAITLDHRLLGDNDKTTITTTTATTTIAASKDDEVAKRGGSYKYRLMDGSNSNDSNSNEDTNAGNSSKDENPQQTPKLHRLDAKVAFAPPPALALIDKVFSPRNQQQTTKKGTAIQQSTMNSSTTGMTAPPIRQASIQWTPPTLSKDENHITMTYPFIRPKYYFPSGKSVHDRPPAQSGGCIRKGVDNTTGSDNPYPSTSTHLDANPDPVLACLSLLKREISEESTTNDRNKQRNAIIIITDAVQSLTAWLWCQFNSNSVHAGRIRQQSFTVFTPLLWSYVRDDTSCKSSQNDQDDVLSLLEAVLDGVWALTMSTTATAVESTSGNNNDDAVAGAVCGPDGDELVHVLLMVMQSWNAHASIQERGCRILACLASASSNNASVNDGCGSGGEAVATVLRVLISFPNERHLQDVCVRTLFNQCSLSSSAEKNKQIILTCDVGDGLMSETALMESFRRFATIDYQPLLLERFCRLYWCLSSSTHVLDLISLETMSIMAIIIRQNVTTDTTKSSGITYPSLCETALCAMAGLAQSSPRVLESTVPRDVLTVVLEALVSFSSHPSIFLEACTFVANLSTGSAAAIVSHPEIPSEYATTIVSTMKLFPEDDHLQHASLRALNALASASSLVQSALLDEPLCSQLLSLSEDRGQTRTELHVLLCRLWACLHEVKTSLSQEAPRHVISAVCSLVMDYIDSESLVAAACATLCVIFFRSSDIFCSDKILTLTCTSTIKCITAALENHPGSESIQHDCCSMVWELCVQSKTDIDEAICIVWMMKALKGHLGSMRVIQVTFTAIRKLIQTSHELKQVLAETEGAVEATICVLHMYPDHVKLLESALDLLASLFSSPEQVTELATSERVEAVVYTMRNHRTHLPIVELAVLFLRNSVTVMPELVKDADQALTVVMSTLVDQLSDESSGNCNFIRQACCLLWVVSTISDQSKRLILELDGMTVLMEALDKYSNVPGVQAAALGAFNELF